MGSIASTPSSPTIHANGEHRVAEHNTEEHKELPKQNGEIRNGEQRKADRPAAPAVHEPLPAPGAPPWVSYTMKKLDSLAARPDRAGMPHYDSPYSRSISSTAPGSPRM